MKEEDDVLRALMKSGRGNPYLYAGDCFATLAKRLKVYFPGNPPCPLAGCTLEDENIIWWPRTLAWAHRRDACATKSITC